MPSEPLRIWAGRLAAGLGLAVLGFTALVADEVLAGPPTEADFRITYFPTDEYGKRRTTQLSTNEMNWTVGKARCECDQKLVVRIGRNTSTGNTVDPVQLAAYVGQQCATAQAMPGVTPYSPCVQVAAGLPAVFQNAPEYHFSPIWLAWGVSGDTQSIESAVPDGTCDSVNAQGGVWMCAGITECMMGNFFMQGTANVNVGEMGTPQGVTFDFVPPLTAPTNFTVEAGDSAVEISWDATSVADIAGYRVLCADAEGNPLDIYDYAEPSASDLVTGQHYFTRENLCPGGQFGEDYDPMAQGWTEDETGTDSGTDTSSDTSTDSGTDTSSDSGTDTSSDSGSTDSGSTDSTGGSCQIGELGCLCGEGDTCDPGLECSPQGFCGTPQASTGLLSLDWDYVCTPHVSGTSQSIRIDGLENGVEYQFLVVTYDFSGNPVAVEAADIITASPVETRGLWEQCEAQGAVCGEPGFCAVVEPSRSRVGALAGLLVFGLLGVPLAIRSRRRRAA